MTLVGWFLTVAIYLPVIIIAGRSIMIDRICDASFPAHAVQVERLKSGAFPFVEDPLPRKIPID